MIPFILTDDGTMTIVVCGHAYVIDREHHNYQNIRQAIIDDCPEEEIQSLVDLKKVISESFNEVEVTDDGRVLYDGREIHNSIARRIKQFVIEGLPFKPLALFFSNLMQNPSSQSVNELYDFLEHEGFPITEDGCFMAYKGVTDDLKDCHTRSFDNSVGQVVTMERNQVDDNRGNNCSQGLHVGTEDYARKFGQTVVLVKVNPRDAVSVPMDHDCSKLRVCRYEVMAMSDGQINRAVYRDETPVTVSGPEWENVDYEDDCEDEYYDEYDDTY